MGRRILITGASVAGNAAALCLGRRGFDVEVVERAPGFRDGGQNVDVRGAGRTVLRRLGLERAALDAGTGEEGTAWVDARGRVAARMDAGGPGGTGAGGEGPTAEMEILRGDLARLLFDAAQPVASFRFGDRVTGIEQDGAGATVSFAGGATGRYDLVVVAEGVGSPTRELVFPGENRPRAMDLTVAYFTIPRTADDDRLWRWYSAPGGRSISLRPDRHGTTRATLSLHGATGDADDATGGADDPGRWDAARQKAMLRARFADAGWQAPRVLAGMEGTADFYLDVLRQVRMPRWSRGRVVLTGDAAWCVTPLGGVGTTLAVTGAYVLAGELGRTEDLGEALAGYERAMRPTVAKAQGVPKLAPRLMHPRTRTGIRMLHAALRFAARPGVQKVAGRLFGGGGVEPELGRYGAG